MLFDKERHQKSIMEFRDKISYPLIDIHAHVLYGVDDGARTLEESCELIEQAAASGFAAIVATPHYSRRRGVNGYEERLEQLKQAISERKLDVQLYLGQETYYHEELPERLKDGKAFTMNDTLHVLVEFDTNVSFQSMYRAIRRFQTSGYLPILAHMERYECLRDEKHLSELCSSGCLLQMNYESLEGHWLSPDVRWCRKQVKNGNIHFLATDMHRIDYRSPEIQTAFKWLIEHVEPGQVKRMVYENPLRMLKNQKIS